MYRYTAQGIYIKKNIERFADTNNSTSSNTSTNVGLCDTRVNQITSEYETKL